MEERKVLVQRLTKTENEDLEIAKRYYSLLSAVNGIKLTEREIQLIAFTAVKGNMSYASNREEFCKMYNSSSPTINNMISRLKKLNVLIKESGKIKVNPKILLNFENDIVLQISLVHG